MDQWVLLCEFLLLHREVVESTVVALGVAMLGAVDVAALARQLDQAHFLLAVPALVAVSLTKHGQ